MQISEEKRGITRDIRPADWLPENQGHFAHFLAVQSYTGTIFFVY
jgi:hypothetical protein